MVLADDDADPVLVAADLVTQAEHGPDSPAILVTTDPRAGRRRRGRDREPPAAPRAPRRSSGRPRRARPDRRSRRTSAPRSRSSTATPRSTSRSTSRDAEAAAARIRNAGSIFVGPWAPESAGDYATGANHVLPTGGLARASGPLSVEAFGRFSQIQRLDGDGLAAIARHDPDARDDRGADGPPQRRRRPLPRRRGRTPAR